MNDNHAPSPWLIDVAEAALHHWSPLQRRWNGRDAVPQALTVLDVHQTASPLTAAAIAEDWVGVLAGADRLDAAASALPPDRRSVVQQVRSVILQPLRAEALARLGRVAEAEALIAPTPMDCDRCLTVRGVVAEAAGDRAAADRWFAEAARLTPSLPRARLVWGRARLARGDLDGAIRLFRQAEERGPRWADPLKYEGDALAAGRDWDGALSRYAAAAERAPRWGALHLAWGRALAASGNRDDALAKWRAAAAMDLSAADRAEVQRLLGPHA